MTRSLQSPKLDVTLSATVKHESSKLSKSASGLVKLTKSNSLDNGIGTGKANRAWQWSGTITSGSSVVLDMGTFAGFDLFGDGNDGTDIVGQSMTPFEEVVAIVVSNDNANDAAGSLEIEPDASDGFSPIGSHTVANGGALKGGGVLCKLQQHEDGFDVESNQNRIKFTANGGDVDYSVALLGRHDDEASSSSSSLSSSSSSTSSASTSSVSSSSSSSSISSSSSSSSSSVSSSSSSSSSP